MPACTAALRVLLLVCLLILQGQPTRAQDAGAIRSPILTLDSERMFQESQFGKRTARNIEARSSELAAENRRIEAELGAEEKDLTEKRPVMEPAAFRALADAFDAKVQATRRVQEAKTRALNQLLEERRVFFLNAAVPVLEDLMRASGAAIILERRSVFLSAAAIDITDDAISSLDAVLGEGTEAPAKPSP